MARDRMAGRRADAPRFGVPLMALALGAATMTTACGAGRSAGRAARPGDMGSLYELGAGDLARATDAPNVFTAIERLRPLFFRPRVGPRALRGQQPELNVFINGSFSGPADILRTIPVEQVAGVRFVQPSQAATTIGSRMAGDGVIMVTLKHPRAVRR